MVYRMLLNAECENKLLRYKWKSLGFHDSGKSMSAIDELGRIFSWGQNWWGYCGLGNCERISGGGLNKPELGEIESATQVGGERNWVKSYAGEMSTIALNFLGELWGWGNSDYQCSPFALPTDSGEGQYEWEGIDPPLYYADNFYTPTRVAPGFLCKDVAHDYYHTLAIGMDDKLYVWGPNLDSCLGTGGTPTGGGPPYAGLVHDPLLHPLLTDDIKLIHCHLLTSIAVTISNKVYVWGETWWWNIPIPEYLAFDSPTPIELVGLPGGCDIVDCYCCGYGVAVLLSNGEVWAAGSSPMFGDGHAHSPTAIFERVDVLAGKNIIKLHVGSMGGLVFYAIDFDGNVWGWGDAWYFSGNEGPEDYICRLMISNSENQHKFIDAGACSHQIGYFAIDTYGYLWSWGSQTWSPILAIGVGEDEVLKQLIAQRAAEALDYKGEPALLNIYPQWESEYDQPLPQLADHEPCGHWYLRLWEEGMVEEWPGNCWMTSLAIRDGIVFFVGAGRYADMKDDKGFDLLFMTYDISHNVWTRLYWGEMVYTAMFPGGAAIHEDVYGYLNYKYDVTGTPYNNVYLNPAIGVWITSPTGLEYSEFATGGKERSGKNKIGVRSSGLIAIAYEDSVGDLVVQVSTDFGATWNLRHTIVAEPLRKDFSLVIDDSDHIYLVHQTTIDGFTVERSIDNGLNWTDQIVDKRTYVDMTEMKLTVEVNDFDVFCYSDTEFRIYNSINECVDFYYLKYDDGTIVAARFTSGETALVKKADAAFDPSEMYFYAYDDVYGGWKWNPSTLPSSVYSWDAIMAGHSGIFVYAAYAWYVPDYDHVMLLISEDMGANWSLCETPLHYYADWSEMSGAGICPIWELPGQWVFEKSNWTTEFKKQEDKLQPCEGFKSIPFIRPVTSLPPTAAPVTASPDDPSDLKGIVIIWSTLKQAAIGSDNFPMTWADDNNQYTSWGDGYGFDYDPTKRSLGVSRVIGDYNTQTYLDRYYGGDGKSYGMLAVGSNLYMWVGEPGSMETAWTRSRIYKSTDYGASWSPASWYFVLANGFHTPTFMQAGKAYTDALDGYVYSFAPCTNNHTGKLLHKPGWVYLMRCPIGSIMTQASWEFYAGGGAWTNDVNSKSPCLNVNDGIGELSVTYNKGLGKYILATQYTKGFAGYFRLYQSSLPQGPWNEFYSTTGFGGTTFYFNFAPKWMNGVNFALVYSGIGSQDAYQVVQGYFVT